MLEAKLQEDSVGKIKQMGVNASKVFEIMKTLQAMKLQKKDSKPGEVIEKQIFIGGVGTAYNK
jgi:protein-tyrosine phosphatase